MGGVGWWRSVAGRAGVARGMTVRVVRARCGGAVHRVGVGFTGVWLLPGVGGDGVPRQAGGGAAAIRWWPLGAVWVDQRAKIMIRMPVAIALMRSDPRQPIRLLKKSMMSGYPERPGTAVMVVALGGGWVGRVVLRCAVACGPSVSRGGVSWRLGGRVAGAGRGVTCGMGVPAGRPVRPPPAIPSC